MYRATGRFVHSLFLLCLFANGLIAQQAQPAPKRVTDSINTELPPWVRLNGEYRMRIEGINGGAFRPDANDTYALSRVRLNLSFAPQSWLRLNFQGQDAQVFGRNSKPDAAPFEDTFDLRQAYVEFGKREG